MIYRGDNYSRGPEIYGDVDLSRIDSYHFLDGELGALYYWFTIQIYTGHTVIVDPLSITAE